uniref:Uncharacterized protein n=1 Tax=Anguilla anguilla TaxID=7936 RepID=A0A0E9U4L4_ANGAN
MVPLLLRSQTSAFLLSCVFLIFSSATFIAM